MALNNFLDDLENYFDLQQEILKKNILSYVYIFFKFFVKLFFNILMYGIIVSIYLGVYDQVGYDKTIIILLVGVIFYAFRK